MTELAEKDAIREVMAEYCFRLDNDRFADMAALFTEDGTWDTAFGKGTGRAEVEALVRRIRGIVAASARDPSCDECRDQGRWRDGEVLLQLGHGAEQRAGAEDRLGGQLQRRFGEAGWDVAVPLSQDRPVHPRQGVMTNHRVTFRAAVAMTAGCPCSRGWRSCATPPPAPRPARSARTRGSHPPRPHRRCPDRRRRRRYTA